MPPFHFTTIKTREEQWKKQEYSKKFHYIFDTEWQQETEKSLIARSLQENNRHTYIERALYNNQALKYTLSIGMFVPPKITDYPKYEKELIDKISEVIYENSLKTKDLWREFDLNRSASPFMYLDREKWKKLLREVDKLVDWRYKNFGEPTLPEKDPTISSEDFSKIKDNIKRKGYTSRYCMLRMNPTLTADTLKALEPGTTFIVIDADTRGYYKVRLEDEKEGWIIATSVKITDARRYIPKAIDNKIPKPEISATMTHEEYLAFQALTDPKLIDEYAQECEPYDKGLKEIIEAPVVNDDRLTSLTKQETTINNNSIYYAVTEGSPGDDGHCVKPAAELNVMYKPNASLKVDPVYPDLIVPPKYAPTQHNINQQNPIPLSVLQGSSMIKDLEEFENSQLTFDYELLNEKKKKSTGKPLNYLDPYPYDDKIVELEKHYPKIKIDSIESRLYESNHPGDQMPQPVAKNFAMVYDAMLKQSASTEARLVRIENVLAQVLRSVGRIGSRVNVNCVYYGGQDNIGGKYKSIRCLCDDRVHDACSVTIDQCFSCTRYEPILGQVYDILDETGMNGSILLDNIQMGYQNLEDLKNLNRVERRNTKTNYANVNADLDKPESQMKQWEEADKQAYIATLKKTITDESELEKKIKDIKQEDYAFKMNWYEQDLELQQPDVKPYPLEGIVKRYKRTDLGNAAADIEDNNTNVIVDDTDQDYIKDLTDLDKLNNGEWVDTREEADTFETNEYSSEDYYFENFNTENYTTGSVGGVFGAEVRQKIVEKAKEIVELHAQGKAAYSQGSPSGNRTVDDTNRIIGGNKYLSNVFVYDCSSMVSCCYKYAGLNSMYNKNTNGQIQEVVNTKGMMWLANEEGLKKALPGDLIYTANGNSAVSESMMGKFIGTQHVLVYIGDNKVAHASTDDRPVPKQIRIDNVDLYMKSCNFFVRPKDLMEADEKAKANGINGGGNPAIGKITTSKGETYMKIYEFPRAVCSAYSDIGAAAAGVQCNPAYNNIVAAHNIPYGTIIYIRELDGKAGGGSVRSSNNGSEVKNLGQKNNGIFYVGDTGGPYFDFDINTTTFSGKSNMDVTVLEWGTSSTPFWSFTDAINYYDKLGKWPLYPDAVRTYRKMGGSTIKFYKFKETDKNIDQNPKWTMIT